MWRFIREMARGDLVVVPYGSLISMLLKWQAMQFIFQRNRARIQHIAGL